MKNKFTLMVTELIAVSSVVAFLVTVAFFALMYSL